MKNETQRLFFALWPDQSLRRELSLVQRGFSGGRLTHIADLHLTLVFLGAVSAEQCACITDVADGITTDPFSLEIDRIGYWKRPRILWCGPSVIPEPLGALAGSLQVGMENCGFPRERRTFSPHVTLARKASPVAQQSLENPLIWHPSAFVLVSSSSGRAPPYYHIVKKWLFDR